jgi:isochorismate hydrolase
MIAQAEKSQLIIIDMQEKIASAMPKEIINKMIRRLEVIQTACNELGIPQIFTEQYPKGLGHTLTEILPQLHDARFVEKTVFDCTNEPAFEKCLVRTRSQVFLLGIEAHICILQTAMSLLKKGKDVFIIEDLVASRNISNKQNALNRLRECGCIITNTESVVFEWIKSSEHEAFEKIAPLIKSID